MPRKTEVVSLREAAHDAMRFLTGYTPTPEILEDHPGYAEAVKRMKHHGNRLKRALKVEDDEDPA